jgi:hypothetical protein
MLDILLALLVFHLVAENQAASLVGSNSHHEEPLSLQAGSYTPLVATVNSNGGVAGLYVVGVNGGIMYGRTGSKLVDSKI